MLNFSNPMNNTDYTVLVVAINCAGSSSHATAKVSGRLSESFRVLKVLLAFEITRHMILCLHRCVFPQLSVFDYLNI